MVCVVERVHGRAHFVGGALELVLAEDREFFVEVVVFGVLK